jgi:hypothetical protein
MLIAFLVPLMTASRAIGLTQRMLVGVELGAMLLLGRALDRAQPRSSRARVG